MSPWIVFLGECALILFLLEWARYCGHKRGQKQGYDDGYEAGRKDADNWWLGAEAHVIHEQIEMDRRKLERRKG